VSIACWIRIVLLVPVMFLLIPASSVSSILTALLQHLLVTVPPELVWHVLTNHNVLSVIAMFLNNNAFSASQTLTVLTQPHLLACLALKLVLHVPVIATVPPAHLLVT